MRAIVALAAFFSVVVPLALSAAPSDVATIRALRLENNRAIADHNAALMKSIWSPRMRLIVSDGTVYSGASSLAKSYADTEFKDPRFIAYVRIPRQIEIAADGLHAAENGSWTAVQEAPGRVRSGTYLASWEKVDEKWRIVYEAYASLNRAPQSVADVVRPSATIATGGHPDWMAITPNAVWVSNDALKAVQRIDIATNRVVSTVHLPSEPCSGLATGFGSLWVPLCGAHKGLARVDMNANRVTAVLDVSPAFSEGGITASGDSLWLAIENGTLARIDPVKNGIRQRIPVPPGSFNPLYADGVVWITSGTRSVVSAIDARTGRMLREIPVGLGPRFLTAGGGAVWTLNQGDGTISKIDEVNQRLAKTIATNIPGGGGEITFGAGAVWATIIGVPLTRVDAKTGNVTEYGGRGGDAVRYGQGAVWLTDYFGGRLWRFPQ
jgi:hypothetical protein